MKPDLASPELAAMVQRFRGRRILVIGDLILDEYTVGTAVRLSPEAPVPVVKKGASLFIPGGAANVAANIASLGGQSYLVGVTGDDESAVQLRSALVERSIRIDHLTADCGRKTSVKTRIIAGGQHLVRVDDEDTTPVSGNVEARLVEQIGPLIDTAEAVVISDYAKGVLTPGLLRFVIGRATGAGRRVVVDPKHIDYHRYDGSSILTPNSGEALQAAGISVHAGAKGVAEAGIKLMMDLQIGALLITRGEAGMTLFQRQQAPLDIPATARAVYDVTGAGDTVVATIALALGSGLELSSAARIANLAAGLAVEKIGTAAVNAAELEAVLTGVRGESPKLIQDGPAVPSRDVAALIAQLQ